MEGLAISIAKEENRFPLIDYMVDHFKDQEPITRSLKIADEDARVFFTDLVKEGLEFPVSFLVFNERNEIVGCRLNTIIEKGAKNDNHHGDSTAHYALGPKHIVNLLEALLDGFEDLLPNFRKAMQFVTVSVHPGYQRRGVAQKLVELSIAKAQDLQCDYIIVTATALRSQQLFTKLGFYGVKEIKYTNYRDNEDRQIIKCDDGTEGAKLMVKDLKTIN